jgi:hypothetical protein
LAVEASGTVENMVTLEEMDMNKAAEHATKLWLAINLLANYLN